MLLAVDDDSGDLLVHEDKDGAQQSRNGRRQQRPRGVGAQRRHQPTTVLRSGLQETGSELRGNTQSNACKESAAKKYSKGMD